MQHPVIAAVLLLGLGASGEAAASSLETFDVKAAATTCGTAISSDGFVTGLATQGQPQHTLPFGYRRGHFVFPRPYVPAGLVVFSGVNSSWTFVGSDIDSKTLGLKSFVYAHKATSFPTMSLGSILALNGINDDGTLLGQVSVSAPSRFAYETLGFTKTASGEVTLIDDGSGHTQPTGMDTTESYVVGRALDGAGTVGWVYHAGSFAPVAFPGALFTTPMGVNANGFVVGTYTAGSLQQPVTHGFRLHQGEYKSWDVPGADATQIEAMNASGQLTGCYQAGGKLHGYIYTP